MEKENGPIEGEEVLENPFANLDLSNLSGLLKNVDINQILNLLNTVDLGSLSGILGGAGGGLNNGAIGKRAREIEVLSAIKPMLSADRAGIIDIILQVYTISKFLK
jgi:hypothetical protein